VSYNNRLLQRLSAHRIDHRPGDGGLSRAFVARLLSAEKGAENENSQTGITPHIRLLSIPRMPRMSNDWELYAEYTIPNWKFNRPKQQNVIFNPNQAPKSHLLSNTL
jgi:hypothetical protein